MENFSETEIQPEVGVADHDESNTIAKVAVLAAALPLAACGGGGSDGGSTAVGPGESGSGGGVITPAEITPTEASRFLGQAQMFATQAEIDQVVSDGYESWLNQQFNTPVQQTAYDWLFERGFTTVGGLDKISHFCWRDLLSAPDALRKRVAFVLSEICVVSALGLPGLRAKFLMAAYWDLLNEYAFGNFSDFLKAITLNPAMGRYLNMAGNRKANAQLGSQPDENYAREVMQLFTIGLFELNLDGSLRRDSTGAPIETYGQEDVTELAKVFTGWDIDRVGTTPENQSENRNPMVFFPARHSNEAASFLGSTIPAGTPGPEALDVALNTLFRHPNLAPFWARQLIQKMVTSNPSPAYIERVARVFENNGNGVRGDMKAVIRAVLLDIEARASSTSVNASFGKLREPVARFVQWARTFDARTANEQWRVAETSNPASALGQSPLRSPSVFNFFRPNYVPSDVEFASRNLVGPEFQLLNEVSVAGYVNFMTRTISNSTMLKADYAIWLELAATPVQLIDRLTLLFAPGQVTQSVKQDLVQAISSIQLSGQRNVKLGNRLHAAILMIMASPNYLIQK